MRTRDYITTYSGHAFSPLAPDADAIDLRDVAHALARIGRANGHFADFYSVGQHCLDCAQEALARGYSARQALACLLHDASEAYMADITSPVKKNLRQYVAVEDHLLDVIYQKYLPGGIRPREQRVVKEIDNAMLYHEFVHFMGEKLADEEPVLYSEPCFSFTSFWSVEKQYLFFFEQLTRQMQQEEINHSWQTVGILYDGAKWQAAVLSDNSYGIDGDVSLLDLCNRYKEADAVLIAMPVGLPERAEDAVLRPEQELRRLHNGCNTASVPCRQAVYAESDAVAREENIRVLGRTISPQQLKLRQQLREVDELLLYHNEWKNVLRESYPQLLGQGWQMVLQQYRDQLPQGAGRRNAEDALCLAVIGQLECRNGSATLPAEPANDARGIRMQVVIPRT